MLGSIRYEIEGLPEFEAEVGDVVYVPRQTWHLASFGVHEGLRSCRLAMNGFPYQAPMFERTSALSTRRGGGFFMRHPKGGPHYDGALNEDTWVAISGYGPTKAAKARIFRNGAAKSC